jgi:hypothetical protein
MMLRSVGCGAAIGALAFSGDFCHGAISFIQRLCPKFDASDFADRGRPRFAAQTRATVKIVFIARSIPRVRLAAPFP